MLVRDGKWPGKRMESLRGSIMVDVVNGAVRLRAWPRKRGPAKTQAQADGNDKFGQAQRAFDLAAYQQQLWLMEQTEGTPLLPRDILTAMMYGTLAYFRLPDGRKLYPVFFKNDVSEALDALSQTDGMTLVRVNGVWVGLPYGGGPQEEGVRQRVYCSQGTGGATFNVNSLTYVAFQPFLLIWDFDEVHFTEFRIMGSMGSTQAGQTVTMELTDQAGIALSAGDDLIISNPAGNVDSGWRTVVAFPTGIGRLDLRCKGSNVTVDLQAFNCDLLLR